MTVDYGDVQGLVRFGYGKMTEACYFLLLIENAVAARAWLKSAPITSAVEHKPPPNTAMQVAFTWEGLQALGIPRSAGTRFSGEFMAGVAGDESRSRRLGDVGASDPSRWQWGGPGRVPHVLVMLYAEPTLLDGWKQTIKGAPWAAAFRELACLSTSHLDGVEPFGFADGISQPTLDWQQQRRMGGTDVRFGNLVALGEFLLGYPNEHAKYTERPLLTASDDPHGILLAAGDSGHRDFGLNGTYIVYSDLEQYVRTYWGFLHRQAGGDPERRRWLAARMVGRTMAGEPLMPAADLPIAGVDPQGERLNRFTYDADGAGIRCPLGAHIRRANPRTADFPVGTSGFWARVLRVFGFGGKRLEEDVIASARFHRILRRGREYGEGLSPDDAVKSAPAVAEDRGVRFICLNANLARQFEFVQSAWMMGTKFAGLTEESDALLGNRAPLPGCPATDTFSIPRESGLASRLTAVPRFVTVRGGAYFFLPSLRAVRYLARLGNGTTSSRVASS